MAPLTARQIGGALLRDATPADAAALAAIYNHYILHTVVTFEEQVIDAAEMARRLAAVMAQHPWLVLEADGELLGYAYAGTWKPRSAYRFTVETTVYLAAQAVGAAVAGHTQISSTSLPPAVPQLRAGKVRAIAVTSARRSAWTR